MKKLIVSLLCLLALTSGGFGQGETPSDESYSYHPLEGIIIDNASAEANKDNLGEYIKTYTKIHARMSKSVLSGYSLYVPQDNILCKFDSASSLKIKEFLDNPENSLHVHLTVLPVEGGYKIIAIINKE